MEDQQKEVNIEQVSVEDISKEAIKEQPENIIQQLNDKIAELNDKYLRVAAELENTRRRASIDIETISRNRSMSVVEKFLPVIDAVEAALKLTPNDEGIKSMSSAIKSACAQIGIVKIESLGQVLNPQLHNAIQIIDKPTEDTKTNTILEEMQTGYMFGDTVLRTAMVIVSR